jgi:hypothetical protein
MDTLTERIDANYRAITALTDQIAQLVRERDELQKIVWRYEKHGVTCQTYGNVINSSCSECNVNENYSPVYYIPTKDDAIEAEKKDVYWHAIEGILNEYGLEAVDFVSDFKAALKAAEKQEPVAWMQADHEHISLWKDDYHTIPLYTHSQEGHSC